MKRGRSRDRPFSCIFGFLYYLVYDLAAGSANIAYVHGSADCFQLGSTCFFDKVFYLTSLYMSAQTNFIFS